MRAGVIGAGRIGSHIGAQLAAAGHEVRFSYSRDADKLERLAEAFASARSATPREAAEFGDVLIFSVPWRLIDDVLGEIGSLEGKVVVDTTNQFGRGGVEALPEGLSAVETNARRMSGAALVKAFNTLTAAYQRSVAAGAEGEVAMFYAAEEQRARDAAELVIGACGFVPVHIGGWDRVQLIEAPRRRGAAYGEAYRPDDARRIAAAPIGEAARLADELKLADP